MKGWLLDTNVVAELTRDRCDARVRAWAEAQNERYLFISVLTLGEYRKGIANLPDGDPAGARYHEMLDRLQERFGDRVIAVSDDVAIWWGMIQRHCETHDGSSAGGDRYAAGGNRHPPQTSLCHTQREGRRAQRCQRFQPVER